MASEGVGRREVVGVRVSSWISGQLPYPLRPALLLTYLPALLGFQGSMGPVPVLWPKSPLLLTAQASGEPCRSWFAA